MYLEHFRDFVNPKKAEKKQRNTNKMQMKSQEKEIINENSWNRPHFVNNLKLEWYTAGSKCTYKRAQLFFWTCNIINRSHSAALAPCHPAPNGMHPDYSTDLHTIRMEHIVHTDMQWIWSRTGKKMMIASAAMLKWHILLAWPFFKNSNYTRQFIYILMRQSESNECIIYWTNCTPH